MMNQLISFDYLFILRLVYFLRHHSVIIIVFVICLEGRFTTLFVIILLVYT